MASLPTLREMLENGVHFGHTTARWNPKMKPYIFSSRDNVHVINLEHTRAKLDEALKFLTQTVEGGGTVLFVGTKRQAKGLVKSSAIRCGMPYAAERWFGGELTNFPVLRKNVKTLEEIEQGEASGAFDRFTKNERLKIEEKKRKLLLVLEGVRNMAKLPDAVFVIDSGEEAIAVREARSLHIPVIAVVDTDANPEQVDYPIPANDDATKSLSLLLETVSTTIHQARARQSQAHTAPEAKAEVQADEDIAKK